VKYTTFFVSQTLDQFINQSNNNSSIVHTINYSTKQTINQHKYKSIIKSINPSIPRPINKSFKHLINQSINNLSINTHLINHNFNLSNNHSNRSFQSIIPIDHTAIFSAIKSINQTTNPFDRSINHTQAQSHFINNQFNLTYIHPDYNSIIQSNKHTLASGHLKICR
jgi:predicted negative regulator of RcsB-dependent stress response